METNMDEYSIQSCIYVYIDKQSRQYRIHLFHQPT